MPGMSHDALARDLAAHLHGPTRMTWCDLQLGEAGSPRPDVYTLCRSFRNPAPTAYECKVSRGDFLSDVTTGKWQVYLRYSGAVWFACEAGLLKKEEVPTHCGLIVRHPSGAWRAAKRAVLSPVTIPQDALLKLVMDGVGREGGVVTRRITTQCDWDRTIRKKYGADVAKAVNDLQRARFDVESAQRTAARILDDASKRAEEIAKDATDRYAPARAELCTLLGLEAGAGIWQVERSINIMRAALKEHPAQERLRSLTESVRRALDCYGHREEPQG